MDTYCYCMDSLLLLLLFRTNPNSSPVHWSKVFKFGQYLLHRARKSRKRLCHISPIGGAIINVNGSSSVCDWSKLSTLGKDVVHPSKPVSNQLCHIEPTGGAIACRKVCTFGIIFENLLLMNRKSKWHNVLRGWSVDMPEQSYHIEFWSGKKWPSY